LIQSTGGSTALVAAVEARSRAFDFRLMLARPHAQRLHRLREPASEIGELVVLGAPMYNFTIPSQLKAWIDRILVAGKTFKYGPQGAEGLAGGKRVIIAISRGGFYGAGTPAAVGEHLETYLRWVFGFIGVKNLEFISADGVQVGPEHREKALAGALQAATNLHAA
jgi:FMN-dependent NADH-azoreductase